MGIDGDGKLVIMNIKSAVEMFRTLTYVSKLKGVYVELYRDAEYYLNCRLNLPNIQRKFKNFLKY